MKRVLVLFFLFSTTAWARQQAVERDRPVVQALRIMADEKIGVDGRLDEAAWMRAVPITDFKQFEPRNGEPGTERTEIRIIFDKDNLYIGGEFFDSDPKGLLGNQMVRDGGLGADDRFIWVLDPFNDTTSGYYFETNPSGAMGDAQLVPAIGGGNFGVTQNRAWDGIWLARVRRHELGWTVEVQIPFRTLNFDPNGRAWGANFQRTVRRKNEEMFWNGWGRNQGIYSLSFAGQIEGIGGVTQGHGLDIKPYLLGNYSSVPGNSTYKGNEGIDFFYNVTPQIKANFTINTDFAQTEVDDRQVNLTRFPLFFPEKRDFFLESAGNFDFGREQANNISAFFSRRVGLDEVTGRPQKIDYGMKVGGRSGQYNIGLMHVQTGKQNTTGGEEFTVFRPKRLFWQQSYAGLMYTRRAARDSTVPDRHSIGADFQLATARFHGNKNLQFGGWYMKTPNAAKGNDNSAAGLRLNYPNDRWALQMAYKFFEKNFDPAAGFVEQTDYQKWTPGVSFNPRPKNSKLVRQYFFDSRVEFFTNMAGRWIERTYFLTPLRIDFQSGDQFSFRAEPSYIYLQEDFKIRTGSRTIALPQGSDYQFTRYTLQVTMANRRKISGTGSVALGTFYSGNRRDLSATLNLRPRRGILATFIGTFNRVELAEGKFSTKILRAVVNTQFNPFISVSHNIQYDSVSRLLGWQTRFRWIVKPGNDLYFVWLQNWTDTGTQLMTTDRSAATKVVYTYRF
jgi:Domain of unknown function (DUF5916)